MNTVLDKASLQATAARVYEYMITEHPAGTNQVVGVDVDPVSWGLAINNWDWNPGVGVSSIMVYHKTSQRADVLDYLKGWVERNKHKMRKFQHVNVMTPFSIFPDMYRLTGDVWYRDTAVEYANWIVQNSARTRTGALQHGGDLTEEIWADTIYMAALFLSRTARLVGDTALAKEAVEQLRLHLKYLQDPETGVLFHGYFCHLDSHKSSARWTRGNAWITLGTPLILSEVGGMVPVPEEIFTRYRKLADGLARFQAPNGLWHTVMDQPGFYQETSGSSGIAAGLLKSVHAGALPADTFLPVVEKAIGGVLSKISPEGMVDSVSGGTPIMKTIDEYNQLTRYPTNYGQGLTLQLLSEYVFVK